jgi:hypothetical protein
VESLRSISAIRVGVLRKSTPAEHIRNAECRRLQRIWERRRLMPAVGAYARPLAVRSRKAVAAIPRVDFRRVLVVRVSRMLLAV